MRTSQRFTHRNRKLRQNVSPASLMKVPHYAVFCVSKRCAMLNIKKIQGFLTLYTDQPLQGKHFAKMTQCVCVARKCTLTKVVVSQGARNQSPQICHLYFALTRKHQSPRRHSFLVKLIARVPPTVSLLLAAISAASPRTL